MSIKIRNENSQDISITGKQPQRVGVDFNMGAVIGGMNAHITDTENPHKVTAEQTGAIAQSEKGVAGGVAALDEIGKVPAVQLPTIPTTTAQLVNNSGYMTETQVNAKLEEFTHISSGTIEAVKGLENALDEHADEYDELLQQVGTKATKTELNAGLIAKGLNSISADKMNTTSSTGTLASRWIVNDVGGVTEPFHNMAVLVEAPAIANSFLVLSIDGGKTFHPIVTNTSDTFANYSNTTANEKTRTILVVYKENDKAATYLEQGVREEIEGVWQVVNSTDKNDRVQFLPANSASYNKWYHLIFDTSTGDVSSTTYGVAMVANKVRVNPYTGEIDVKGILIDGVDLFSLVSSGGGGGLEMPEISILTVADLDRTGIISPDNPLRVTIKTNGGILREDDEIQLCSKKAMTYKVADEREDATRQRGRRWRYRKIFGRSAEECHPDKSMEAGVYRMICWDIGDDITPRAFLRSDNHYNSTHTVTKYIRVSRLGDNDIYTHSNVVPIQFTVQDLVKPDKNEAKINIR